MAVSLVDDHFQNDDASVRVSVKTGAWQFEPKGSLSINLSVTPGSEQHTGLTGIYGDAEGLLQLADLITAVARIDQTKIPDSNCPQREGIHVTLYGGKHLQSEQVELYVGRLDRKSDGEIQWLDPCEQVMVFDNDSNDE